jgi:hypothetical protein
MAYPMNTMTAKAITPILINMIRSVVGPSGSCRFMVAFQQFAVGALDSQKPRPRTAALLPQQL